MNSITEDDMAPEIMNAFAEHFDTDEYLEVHYNHYGNSGVVDVVIDHAKRKTIFELKADPAIRSATGANEIIRQFNSHREYFFEGSPHSCPRDSVLFELCFAPTEDCVAHVLENWRLYKSVLEMDILNVRNLNVSNRVVFRSIENDSMHPIELYDADDYSLFPREKIHSYLSELFSPEEYARVKAAVDRHAD